MRAHCNLSCWWGRAQITTVLAGGVTCVLEMNRRVGCPVRLCVCVCLVCLCV